MSRGPARGSLDDDADDGDGGWGTFEDLLRFIVSRRLITRNDESGIRLVRRGDAGAGRYLDTLRRQTLLQRGEEEQHIGGTAGVSHQADAPGLALEVAESAADFDAEVA